MYALYVIGVAFIKPAWVPALPPEARTIREDNGKSGLPSLLASDHHLDDRRGCLCPELRRHPDLVEGANAALRAAR